MKANLFQFLLLASVNFHVETVSAFVGVSTRGLSSSRTSTSHILSLKPAAQTDSFIDTELRGAAMRLHTREQAPKEGQVESKPREPYETTREDYLRFLVDSQYIYETLEDIVRDKPELSVFRDTGLERVGPLEKDIVFMTSEYKLVRPPVGQAGHEYAKHLRSIKSIPEFICHYYNFYFAHTAGGRMIGKKMSSLLLDGRTLQFYKVSRFSCIAFLAKLHSRSIFSNILEVGRRSKRDQDQSQSVH